MVEQPAVNRLVAGSNPARGAKYSNSLADRKPARDGGFFRLCNGSCNTRKVLMIAVCMIAAGLGGFLLWVAMIEILGRLTPLLGLVMTTIRQPQRAVYFV